MRLYRQLDSIALKMLLVFTIIGHSAHANAGLLVAGLTVDNLDNPVGIDNATPGLSWKLHAERPSTLQAAYEVRVMEEGGKGGEGDSIIWSSGHVASDQSLYIPYSGPALTSGSRYHWQVRIWDNHGNVSPWSDPAHWEMGLLTPSEWSAEWITYPWDEDTGTPQPSPLLRKDFAVNCDIERARLYITALGLYEASINGRRVGDAYFTPGWTSYDNRLQYQVYDIGDLLRDGSNAIGIALGDGWYRGHLSWEMQRNLYGDRLATKAQIHIDCASGERLVINTDTDWQAGTGAIRESDIYNGEVQDLRLRSAGWTEAGFSGEGWQAAVRFRGRTAPLVASTMPPVRNTKVIRPVAMLEGPDGETIVDMGQNMVGWVRLRASGAAGDTIVLQHAEVRDTDGSLNRRLLRNARQRMQYTLADDEVHYLQPHFTFQGFRYVRVDGYPGSLSLDDIEGIVLHNDLPIVGHFETSNPMLNQLQSNILWGQRGNFLEVPTDCPQRDERLGWTGDLQVFANTATFNMHSVAFFEQWLEDLRLEQFENGAVPVVIPDVLSRLKIRSIASWFFSRGFTSSGWGDVITELPHVIYERYGDPQSLEKSYPHMKRWVEFQRSRAKSRFRRLLDTKTWFSAENRRDSEFIWNVDYSFGDWLSPAPVSTTFVNTAYFARSSQLLAQAAEILGSTGDAEHYAQLHQQIRAAFQRRFVTDDGNLTEDVQGAYVLALQFDLLEPQQARSAAQRLNTLVERNAYHLQTGFLSTPHMLSVLTRYGYADTAHQILTNTEYPSWLYPITKGATTIWERWDGIKPDGSFGDEGMNSFNHYAKGAVGDWMYRNIGGIAPAAPGYRKIRIAPMLGSGLDSARAELESPYGRIVSDWRLEGGRLVLLVDIPANSTAELFFPNSVSSIQRGSKPVQTGSGIHEVSSHDTGVTLVLGSGHFEFHGVYGREFDSSAEQGGK